MISQFCLDVPCRCGRQHHVPLDLAGRWGGVCQQAGKATQFQVDRTQFHRLMREHAAEDVQVDRVYQVHTADTPHEDRQRCVDCGVALLDYTRWQRRRWAFGVTWWKPGSLVGVDDAGNFYQAALPLSPLRERRCYQTVPM